MRLQSKLTLFSAASKISILLLLMLMLPPLVNQVALDTTDERLQEKEQKVIKIIEEQGIENFIGEGGNRSYGSYNLLKEEFISLEETALKEPVYTIGNSLRKVEGEIVEYRVLSLTFQVGDKMYLMEIGRSLDTIYDNSKNLQKYVLYFLVAVVVLTVFVDLAFSNILLQPLRVIIRRLQRIGHPSAFAPHTLRTSTDDFVYLNNTINEMMGQVQTAFQKEKEFIGNVSHELLTPVSILQNRLENLLTDPETPEHLLVKLVDNQKTLHRLKSIIQALLLISRIENEQYIKNEQVNIKELVDEVAEEIEERAAARDIELRVSLKHEFIVQKGNQSLLFTMLFNVVNNAIKYNKEGGKIIISDQLLKNGYELCIADTGVGIPENQVNGIFNRFKRLQAPDGESHGLGLPIVKTVAQFHQIQLSVTSKLGEGSTFCFRFPAG